MARLIVFWKTLLFFSLFTIPYAFGISLFWGWIGFLSGFSFFAILFFLLFWMSEKLSIRMTGARAADSPGLSKTLALTAEQYGLRSSALPRIVVFEDVLPLVLLSRAPFSKGTLLMSRALLSGISERELRSLIFHSSLRLRRPGTVLASVCSVWNKFLTLLFPRSVVSLTSYLQGSHPGASIDLSQNTLTFFEIIGFFLLFHINRTIHFFSRVSPMTDSLDPAWTDFKNQYKKRSLIFYGHLNPCYFHLIPAELA